MFIFLLPVVDGQLCWSAIDRGLSKIAQSLINVGASIDVTDGVS